MVNRRKAVEEKVYSDLTTKQKEILHSASGCDKSYGEISREAETSVPYVSKVLNRYGHMLPTSEEPPETATDGGVEIDEPKNESNASVKVVVNCDCGETHEVSIDY